MFDAIGIALGVGLVFVFVASMFNWTSVPTPPTGAPQGVVYPRVIGEDHYTRATIVETSPGHYKTMSEAEAKAIGAERGR